MSSDLLLERLGLNPGAISVPAGFTVRPLRRVAIYHEERKIVNDDVSLVALFGLCSAPHDQNRCFMITD
jgi:hypothetical protein